MKEAAGAQPPVRPAPTNENRAPGPVKANASATSGRGHQLVANVPIVLKVWDLISASRSIVFQQIDPAVPDDSRTAMCVVGGHRRVARARCPHTPGTREWSSKRLRQQGSSFNSPINNGEAVGG